MRELEDVGPGRKPDDIRSHGTVREQIARLHTSDRFTESELDLGQFTKCYPRRWMHRYHVRRNSISQGVNPLDSRTVEQVSGIRSGGNSAVGSEFDFYRAIVRLRKRKCINRS